MNPIIADIYSFFFYGDYTAFFLYFFILMATLYTLIMLAATPYIISRYREQSVDDVYNITRSDSLPELTFIVPAFNESQSIIWTIRTVLNVSYRYKKIIVVNDGSNDNSMDLLIKNFSLKQIPVISTKKISTQPILAYYQSEDYPELRVIEKVNGGKADAINAALNVCETLIYATTDADTLIDGDALNYLIRPFLEYPETLVVHSSIGIVNGCKLAENRIVKKGFPKNWIAAFQVIEYIRTFYCDRMCWEWSKGSLIVAGVFAIFKVEPVIEVGGYDTSSTVEDMEIIMHIHKKMLETKRDYHIRFVPDVVAWTEVPENLGALTKQRLRWYGGTTQCLMNYKHMCFRPKYKSIGMILVPFYIFDKLVPIVEVFGYIFFITTGFIYGWQWKPFLLWALVCWGYTTFLTFTCILVEELTFRKYPDYLATFKMLGYAVMESISYRFIILYLKLRGLYVPKHKRKEWLVTPKKGFEDIG